MLPPHPARSAATKLSSPEERVAVVLSRRESSRREGQLAKEGLLPRVTIVRALPSPFCLPSSSNRHRSSCCCRHHTQRPAVSLTAVDADLSRGEEEERRERKGVIRVTTVEPHSLPAKLLLPSLQKGGCCCCHGRLPCRCNFIQFSTVVTRRWYQSRPLLLMFERDKERRVAAHRRTVLRKESQVAEHSRRLCAIETQINRETSKMRKTITEIRFFVLMLWMIAQSNPCVMWMSNRSLLSSVDEPGKQFQTTAPKSCFMSPPGAILALGESIIATGPYKSKYSRFGDGNQIRMINLVGYCSYLSLVFYACTEVLTFNKYFVNSVRKHQANSHAKKGWEQFSDAVIKTISQKREGVVFLLWGNYAREKSRLIDATKHHILQAALPSGLSANRGLFGCRHFSRTNQLLEKRGIDPIDWKL
ncbi:hypothetical protein Ahy_B06g083053 [Arachis hypogaea]|uniref:Uracil-DNA glycosylase-like domain-containing protein n=1 Tax=Arachis hypogaea TaxID=3818 RepID=A0A444YPH5_ARAHY|nr:hypothetical protein Ahy_B06g083053 [Arachis hypogaea]